MIRHRRGNEFLLVTQDDHAVAAGRLAERIGNDRFAPPSPYGPTITAICMHDAGWPLHDDRPTLNAAGLPLHVLETPTHRATRIWTESTARATAVNDYAGLLVSLHVLHLSVLSGISQHSRERDELFELNKFQHRQVEAQEQLRQRLGLRIDRPLQLGLAAFGTDADEDQLQFNYRLLSAMDRISLDACCSEHLFQSIDRIHPRASEPPISIAIRHGQPFATTLDPWPFDVSNVEVPLKCRCVSAEPFDSQERFAEAYALAPIEAAILRVAPGR